MTEKINKIRKAVKEKNPLIHCITNPISIKESANVILSLGARPIMAEHKDEVLEITKTAKALLLNIGNITDMRRKSIKISAYAAKQNGIPFVFDAVGVACSKLRLKFSKKLIRRTTPDIIKGNYSEIMALSDSSYKASGVDADKNIALKDIKKAALDLAKKYDCVILASGKTDLVTDGKKIFYIKNGCKKMSEITGTGCMLGCICACFLSENDVLFAAVSACVVLGICGGMSDGEEGNGSFFVKLMDNLSLLKDEDIDKKTEVTCFEAF